MMVSITFHFRHAAQLGAGGDDYVGRSNPAAVV